MDDDQLKELYPESYNIKENAELIYTIKEDIN